MRGGGRSLGTKVGRIAVAPLPPLEIGPRASEIRRLAAETWLEEIAPPLAIDRSRGLAVIVKLVRQEVSVALRMHDAPD